MRNRANSDLEAADLVKLVGRKMGRFRRCTCGYGCGPMAAAQLKKLKKDRIDVVNKATGPKKIEVIKVIRQLTSLGLLKPRMAETADVKVLEADAKTLPKTQPQTKEAGAEVAVVYLTVTIAPFRGGFYV